MTPLHPLLLAAAAIVDPGWVEVVAHLLTTPWVAGTLIVVGVLGLLIEIKAFAHGLAGAAGVLALALFFGSHSLVGMAGWLELVLLTVGALLVILEVVALPGMGAFGILGGLAVLASLFLSLAGHPATADSYSQAAAVLGGALIAIIVAAWALARTLPRSSHLARSGVMLGEATSREAGYIAAAVRSDLLGLPGTAITDLRPAGAAQVGGERLDVVAESGFIPAGAPVVVVRSEGYRHVVRPAD